MLLTGELIDLLDAGFLLGNMGAKELKKGHDIYLEIKNVSEYHLKINDKENFLFISNKLIRLREEEIKHYISSIILFQSFMEAIINNEKPKSRRFRDKWLEKLEIKKNDNNVFNDYANEFYEKLRIPIIHPEIRNGLLPALNNYQFKYIYDGMNKGWLSFINLRKKLNQPIDDNSWDIFCSNNNLPTKIAKNFIDTSKIGQDFQCKYLEYLNY